MPTPMPVFATFLLLFLSGDNHNIAKITPGFALLFLFDGQNPFTSSAPQGIGALSKHPTPQYTNVIYQDHTRIVLQICNVQYAKI